MKLADFRTCLAALAFAAFTCAAADVPGSKDPPFLKRYEGSEIIGYQSLSYESYSVQLPDPAKPGAWSWQPVEGQVTRAFYKVPSGHTVLEIFRNYEQMLKGLGISIQSNNASFLDRDWGQKFYSQSWQAPGDFAWSNLGLSGTQRMAYLAGTGAKNGQTLTVAVYIANYSQPVDVSYPQQQQKVHFNPDNVLVVADVVVAKGVVNKMVTIKAADIAEALASKGKIDIYGIYFDTDKSEIKPDSTPTLDEVASVLKIDRGLRLEVSGHTDNSGDKAHNVRLSQARAQAVVTALVSKYGIDGKRLSAKGYGDAKPVAPNTTDDNKAKNRRVELRKV